MPGRANHSDMPGRANHSDMPGRANQALFKSLRRFLVLVLLDRTCTVQFWVQSQQSPVW